MAEQKQSDKEKAVEIQVNAGAVLGTQYAQIVNVSILGSEVTFEFIFVQPSDITKGQVVSRVTMPIAQAVILPGVIQETIKQHEAKKQ